MKTRRLALVLLAVAVAQAPGSPAAAARTLNCDAIPKLLRGYLQKHLQYRQLSSEIRQRAAESYLKKIDPSKTLLMKSDVDALEKSLRTLFDDISRGNCTKLDDLQKQLVKRYSEMEAFARTLLADPEFALDESTRLVLDPDDRGYPKNAKELADLRKRLIHFQISNYLSADSELDEAKEKLIHRYELLTRRAGELTAEDVYALFLDAFATALDPHSGYFSADALEDFQISTGLSLEGIGVALRSPDGYSVVEHIIPGGAADRQSSLKPHASLKPQDKIIAVAQDDGGDPVDVIDMALRDVVRLIRGKKGTKVHLTILRQGDKTERFTVTIVRDKIDLQDQAASLRYETRTVGDKTLKLGIIELPSFYGDDDPDKRRAAEDVGKLLTEMNDERADGLVLDLSKNGGGLLEQAVLVSGFFIKSGGVVAVRDSGGRRDVLNDRDDRLLYSGPMVVLISRVSASASEILAGALKDYDRAVIVGDDHTFGKGTVQTVVPLAPGLGALKVTTASFFRPGGASTQLLGVNADVVIPSLFNTDEIGEKSQPYALPSQTIDAFASERANGRPGQAQWKPISRKVAKELAKRSAKRIAKIEEFAKVVERLEEAEEKSSEVHLAEMLKEREEASEDEKKDEGAESDAEEKDKDELSIQQIEAVSVLADLVTLQAE